ncbi:MAG: sigma-54-dependent transcriptional regulator [Betaproteobacteria bacterium]
MHSSQILIIDDEPALREILSVVLTKAGYFVDTADGMRAGKARLARGDVDIALCDVNMPDGSGIELLRDAQASRLDTAFVMITGSSSVATAVEALRTGAQDYLLKPVNNEELIHRLEQIEAVRGLREENLALRKAMKQRNSTVFRFQAPGMVQIERLVEKVAPTLSTVLIVGESGTGKGLLAEEIHQRSLRSNRPFISVNCSAIPEQLMESEFFGHTKGAFTGADRARKGLFLEADKGTLFLDEIGELPMPMQTKLLHAIEHKYVRAVGSEVTRQVDVRIIAATNRDLQAMIGEGKFREDLYFRVGMFQISIPPLRERQGDIRALVRHLMRNASERSGAAGMEIDPEAEAYLLAHKWPGNVRELDNVINRARILAENDCITVADLPASLVAAVDPGAVARNGISGDGSLREQLQKVEQDIIWRAIEACGGDRRVAAQRLGISLASLYRKIADADPDAVDKHQSHAVET